MPFGAFKLNSISALPAVPAGPTYAFGSPSPAIINEDGATYSSFPIITTGVSNGTILYPKFILNGVVSPGPYPNSDIDTSPSVTVSNNSASIILAAIPDSTTEGNQSLYCELYTDAGFTNLVATSSSITIVDTSKTIPTFSFVASSTSLGSTITIPAAATTGDVAVCFDYSTTTTLTVPSGFTSINSATTSFIRTTYSYRILTAGQAGTSITGMAGTTRKVMLVFRPSSPINSQTAVSGGSQASTSTVTNQSMPFLTYPKPHIAFAVYGSTSASPTRTWTQTGGTPTEVSSVSTNGIYVKYQINNTGDNPQNATIGMSGGTNKTLQTGTIRFT